MKKIMVLVLLISSLFAGEINWKSYKNGIKGDKPIFLFYSNENCHYCKIALRDMKNDPNFSKYINTNFTPVYIDSKYEDLPSHIDAPATPSFFILKKNGQIHHDFTDGAYGYGGLDKVLPFVNKGLYILGNK